MIEHEDPRSSYSVVSEGREGGSDVACPLPCLRVSSGEGMSLPLLSSEERSSLVQ